MGSRTRELSHTTSNLPSLLSCRRVQALEEYREQMLLEDSQIDVLQCALLIAKQAHPDLVS